MTLSTASFDSFPLGMNVSSPPHEISDRQARYIQDGILTSPGLLIRRGPVTDVSLTGLSASRNKAVGIVQTQLPDGSTRIMVMTDAASGTNACFVFDDTGNQLGTFSWPFALTSSTAFPIINSSPALGGGVWISTSTNYDPLNTSSLSLWRGGYNAQYSTGTMTSTRGSTAVVGVGTTWASSMIGSFLFNTNGDYIGTVAAVGSTTTITLEQVAPFATAGLAYSIRAVRGYVKRISTGVITTATTTATVAGVGTKFLTQGMGTTTSLYRARDMTYVGTLIAVPTLDTVCTLTGAPSFNMDNEPYFAINSAEASSVQTSSAAGLFVTTTELAVTTNARSLANTPGYLTASHANRQWFANLGVLPGATGEFISRVWFSELKNGETVDFSEKDGNFIPMPSASGAAAPIRQIVSTRGGLLVFKENETWIITGTDESNFAPRKLADDGCPSGMSATPWAGGCFWAGKHGIYWFDGSNLTNVVQANLGEYYSSAMNNFTWNTKRMYSTVFRNHLLVYSEYVTPTVAVQKGNVTSLPSKMCFVLNLSTRAITLFYNVEFRGAVVLPKFNTPWYVINEQTTGKFHIANGSSLFDSEGIDAVICEGNTVAGPDFYLETKRYSLGDPLRKKLFKMLLVHYYATGDGLKLDLVTGLNEPGSTNTATWAVTGSTWTFVAATYNTWSALSTAFSTWSAMASSVWLKKKIRFLKRDQFLGFRVYQNSAAVTKLRVGPIQIGYKPLRAGRL